MQFSSYSTGQINISRCVSVDDSSTVPALRDVQVMVLLVLLAYLEGVSLI